MGRMRLRFGIPLAVVPLVLFALPLQAQAQTPPIAHVVVVMLENHSFDSELGFWCDANPGRCVGLPGQVTLADGIKVVPHTAPDVVPNVDHSIKAQELGLADKWDKIVGCGAASGYACISGYRPAAIPNLAALASKYAVLDHAFTLHDAASWGGHLDELAGTSGGFTGDNPTVAPGATTSGPGWGCDAYNKVAPMLPVNGVQPPPQPSCIPDFGLSRPNGGAWKPTTATHVPTILDEMDAAGVRWNIYAMPSATAEALGGNNPGGYFWSACPSFADCLYTQQNSHLVGAAQFSTDAAGGKLPAVSFVMPAGAAVAYSQHNGNSNAAGDNWIGQVAHSVLAGPEAASSILIVTYDDCGCFYDQVRSPIAPDGSQMGTRVPFVVAGPMVKPRYTDSSVTSSTGSILAFIEWDFGLAALGPNDAAANNLTGLLQSSPTQTAAPPHMVWRQLPASAYQATADDDDGT